MRRAHLAAALTVITSANAHITMVSPKPFGLPSISPLLSTGANFPCQIPSSGGPAPGMSASFFTGSMQPTTIRADADNTLSFHGTATHGGGSCQLALTTDKRPSASTKWAVILSIEGGCPTTAGLGNNAVSTYQYRVPQGVPNGEYVFAWTWISKESGQPEFYMNCAPVVVAGSSHNATAASRLPNLFVANLDSVNSCKSRTDGMSIDVRYPEPGPNVIMPGKENAFRDPVGVNCYPQGGSSAGLFASGDAGAGGNGNDDSSPSYSSSVPGTTVPTSSAGGDEGDTFDTTGPNDALSTATATSVPSYPSSVGATTPGVVTSSTMAESSRGGNDQIDTTSGSDGLGKATATSASSSGTTEPSISTSSSSGDEGGMFDTTGGSDSTITAITTPSSSKFTTTTSASSIPASPSGGNEDSQSSTMRSCFITSSTVITTAFSSSSSTVAAPSTSGTPPTSQLAGPCTTKGDFNCVNGTHFQKCASGAWSVLMPMANGTKCAVGRSKTLWGKEDLSKEKEALHMARVHRRHGHNKRQS